MSNNTEALKDDAIKSAMYSSLEGYALLVVDSLEFEVGRELSAEEGQQVFSFIESAIGEENLPEPCPRCGFRSRRPNGEHYCHPSRKPEAIND